MSTGSVQAAEFDEWDHCTREGWATAWVKPPWKQRLCGVVGHQLPTHCPPNDHCPQALARCRRCSTLLGFYLPGTHRYGGYNRDAAVNYGLRPAPGVVAS